MDMPTNALRVLIIEDSEDDALLLLHELNRHGYHVNHERVDTRPALVSALREPWDIVFCDYSMPAMNGMEALRIIRDCHEDLPFIFVSGTIGEDVAVEAMRTGAQDYILKGSLRRLVPAVERELREVEQRRRRREAEKRLHFLAHYDDLTGLPNRNFFMQRLRDAIDKGRQQQRAVTLAYIDLDRFKTANDTIGYDAGNLLLAQVAQRLQCCVDAQTTIARIAGDEFALLLPALESRAEVAATLAHIQEAIAEPFDVHGCMIYLGASIGVSIFPDDADTAEHLMRNADITTFRVKREGGKHYRFYTPDMDVRLEERLSLDHAMRQALPKGQFILHYQPQIALTSGVVAGVEALVRWAPTANRMIPPADFIPLAEDTGFIVPLGEWILRSACAQAAKWSAEGQDRLRMCVNLSARQFYQDDLVTIVASLIDQHNLAPQDLELEITETAIIQDSQRALRTLGRLRELGVQVALDDFGTGYSSLSHLKNFMVDTLKIDRSFISDIPISQDAMAITAAVIAMAAKLGIRVVAEGVETQEQFNFLKQQGCGFAQGYLLGRPALAEQLNLSHDSG